MARGPGMKYFLSPPLRRRPDRNRATVCYLPGMNILLLMLVLLLLFGGGGFYWRSRHRRWRAWPHPGDMPGHPSHGRIPHEKPIGWRDVRLLPHCGFRRDERDYSCTPSVFASLRRDKSAVGGVCRCSVGVVRQSILPQAGQHTLRIVRLFRSQALCTLVSWRLKPAWNRVPVEAMSIHRNPPGGRELSRAKSTAGAFCHPAWPRNQGL